MDQPKTTINLDGVSYDLAEFSQNIQQAVQIYNKFAAQLQDHQLEVMKTKAALQQVGSEITEAIKKELEEKSASSSEAEPVKEKHVKNGADGEPHPMDDE